MTGETKSTASSGRSSRNSGEFKPGAHHHHVDHGKSGAGIGSPKRPSARPASANMYGGLSDSDDEASDVGETRGAKHRTRRRGSSSEEEGYRNDRTRPQEKEDGSWSYQNLRTQGERRELDWTMAEGMMEQFQMGEEVEVSDDEDKEEVYVRLEKNEKGSLGIKIAGGSRGQRRVYIKALVADPALSCRDIQPFDRLISVNGDDTREKGHAEVVELLKAASSPVTLGLLRAKRDLSLAKEGSEDGPHSVTTLHVSLEKPTSGSLGLSLARPSGGEGIYVRVITPDSVAAEEGTLKVGDRLWEINGESVEKASPMEVVDKLKAARGAVHLVVKRESAPALLR